MGFEADSHALGKNVEHHLPNIVPVGCVAGPGVTEPDYEKSVVRHKTEITRLLQLLLRDLLRSQQQMQPVRLQEGLAKHQQEA